jgi:dTDP-4-amino-4,6-dideoxygalactose transaminase
VSKPLVPLFDIRLDEAEIDAVVETLRSGWLTMGPQTQRFEEAFAEHLGSKHVVALSSATAGLHLAYLAAGVGPGDEVVVPAITFVATGNAARYCGATPVFADVVGQHDLSLDPDDVEVRLTERTKAVCAVHYGGYAAPVEELRRLCSERGLALIEDAAHAPSATIPGGGRMLGTYGLAGVFSFFSNKVLSCGEGGALCTDDDEVAARVRSLRSHAMTSGTWERHRGHAASYDVVDLGYNYRMDEPRAALLTARLATLDAQLADRRRLVHRYRRLLAGLDGILVPYPDEAVDASSCYVMPILLEDPELQVPLRQLMLERWGVQTSVLYPAVHEFSAYAEGGTRLPRAELAARTEITLPLYPHLDDADQDRVVSALNEGIRELRRSARAAPAE